MTKSAMMTIRLTPETRAKLDALARDTKRSKSFLAGEAIEQFVDLNAWQIAHIQGAVGEDEAGGPGVPHDEVMRWVKSWGGKRASPRPKPKRSR